jgi:Abortive infection C-terminus
LEKLEKFNDTDTIAKIICAGLNFWEAMPAHDPEKAAAHLNRYLAQDGYQLKLEFRSSYMNGDKLEEYNPYFELRSLRTSVVETATLVRLSHDSINEHVAKARRKVESNDLAGAIASAYTLLEELLKELLRMIGTTSIENEGDIRQLYTLAKGKLNLDPKGESLEKYLKAILDGLQKQVGGLFELANKASDRHARRYNPAKHHAKLAVNAAFTLCEFLLESYEYQQALAAKKKTS